jgi:pimeloyl-ACP methyl ester carboxylesterase
MKNKNILSKLIVITLTCCVSTVFTIETKCAQLNINKSNIFDKNGFDTAYYTFDQKLYISERILFPTTINGKKLMLEMNIDRPADDGKYPVLILTHGRHGPFPTKRDINITKYFDIAKCCFLKERLIVVQLARRGAGLSEGSNMDEYKMTPIDSGKEMVKDIEQALIYIKSKPYVVENKFVIGGHSQGGWAALATASANLKGVTCIINFSGATNYRKQPWSKNWPRKANIDFVRDCKELAQTSRVPSLWIYGDREPLHTKDDIEKMYSTYNNYGGHAKLLLLPRINHDTIDDKAQKLWAKPVHDFLMKNNVISLGS